MTGSDCIEQICASFLERDFDTFHKLWADDCKVVDMAKGTTRSGHEELADICAGIIAAFPDIRYEDMTVFSDGTHAALSQITRATHQGDFEGYAASGQEIVWPSCSIFTLTEDLTQVRAEVFYYDHASLVAQLDGGAAA